ncbi:MAG: SpoIIE family protein phosphatase [Pirellulales bacterium]|nr:SpoIIE family protein phosphatase [Pirellulales bacterium]
MPSTAPPPLKLYVEQPPKPQRPPVEAIGSLPALLQAFESATGWSLRYEQGRTVKSSGKHGRFFPLGPGPDGAAGGLRLTARTARSSKTKTPPLAALETAERLAEAISGVLDELQRTRLALGQREAELASCVSVSPSTRDEAHLVEQLQATLRGAGEAVQCQAAGLYLLDEATTELKLRASWGLPIERLAAPARPLKECLPDLEALLGHAVVLENTKLIPAWTAPEDFSAAVCVPVSSPTTLLGTLWVFCRETRDFTDQQVNVLEIAAGKIAGDLEREALLRDGLEGIERQAQWTAAGRLQRHRLPPSMPLFDGWEIAGRTVQPQGVGSVLYDWFCLPDGGLAWTAGESLSRGLEGALSIGAVQAAIRAHGQYHRRADAALQQVNLALWTSSAGDQFAALAYGMLEAATGTVRWAAAGGPSIVLFHDGQWKSLTSAAPPLGESPETEYPERSHTLQPGEVLVVYTSGFRKTDKAQEPSTGEEGLVRLLAQNIHLPAAELAALACESLRPSLAAPPPADSALLVIKRLPEKPSDA